MRLLLFVLVCSLSGCQLVKQKVQDVPTPLNYQITESPQDYLEKSLFHFNGSSQVIDSDAMLYKLPGAAKYKQSLAKILQEVEHACLNHYGGKIYTKAYKGEYLSEAYLVNHFGGDDHAIRVAYKDGDKLRLPPYAIGIGPLDRTSKKIASIISPLSPVTWPEVYEYGFCATKDYGTGLFDYHFAVEYFTTREEHKGPENLKPLYVTYFHDAERIKKVEKNTIDRYINKVNAGLSELKDDVLYYYGEYQTEAFHVKFRLTSKEWDGENLLRVIIKGNNAKPVIYGLGDFSNISSHDGTTYAITFNADGPIGKSSADCPILNDMGGSVLINPGVTCNIKVPIVVGGLPFNEHKMKLKKGNFVIPLISYTKYDRSKGGISP